MKKVINEPIRIQSKDGTIVGHYFPSGKVQILAKSFFRNIAVNSTRESIKTIRTFLINSGYVNGNELCKDYIFDNPSTAISVMLGRMESGNKAFITLDNIELGAFLEADSIEEYKSNLSIRRKLIDDDDKDGFVSTFDIDSSSDNYYQLDLKKQKIISNIAKYERDPNIAKRAIIKANYKCEIDEAHETFITKNGNLYMEAHHLIPLGKQDEFKYSLDIEANLVCLCPNCHRKLHYGENIKKDIQKLFIKRVNNLKLNGIEITYDGLLSFYEEE